MNKPGRIIIHHSLTPDSGSVSWGAIRDYHVLDRGWQDIGYHAGCEVVGNKVECFFGRPWTEKGAHTRGHNTNSLGFCFVGDYDLIEPDPMMIATAARRVLAPWCKQFDLRPADIHAHREYGNKTCPGLLFDMATLRDIVHVELEMM